MITLGLCNSKHVRRAKVLQFKGGSVSDPAPYGKNIRAIREAAAGIYV